MWVGGGGLASVLDVQSLFFLWKKIWFELQPDIMLIIYYWQEIFLLTLTSDSWSHSLMIPWHCLGLNRTTERLVNLNMTWLQFFLFLFDFFYCSFTCTVRLLLHSLCFEVMQMKQYDCKMSTKKNFLRKHFRIFLNNYTHKNVKPWRSR